MVTLPSYSEVILKLGSASGIQQIDSVHGCCFLACKSKVRTGSHGKLGDAAAGINLPYNLHVQAVPCSRHCCKA